MPEYAEREPDSLISVHSRQAVNRFTPIHGLMQTLSLDDHFTMTADSRTLVKLTAD